MKIDISEINCHCQLTEGSCIPMAVESILKLLHLMKVCDFSLQLDPVKSGNSDWINLGFSFPSDNPLIEFKREFLLSDLGLEDRGDYFMNYYFDKLFARIDEELTNDSFVIISLQSGPDQWHMEVIFDKVNDDEYQTFTFYHNQCGPKIYQSQNLRQRVTTMKGTDILTYEMIKK